MEAKGATAFFWIFSTILVGNADCASRPLDVTEHLRFKRNASDNCPTLVAPMDDLTQEEFMLKLTDSCRYDHLTRPPSDRALTVDFQIDMRHMENVANTQFLAHLLVQIHFQDERLKFAELSPKRDNIVGEEKLKNQIWVPHIFVKNEKSSSLLGFDQKDVFIKITPLGDIIYSFRMTTTFYCAMDLRKFPFDHQTCQLVWTSWAYNESNLELQWVKNKPSNIANVQLTEFTLTSSSVEYAKTTISDTSTSGWEETYSSLKLKFHLKREPGYYILEYFLPSIFLVVMSWVTFWLQADASPARTALGTASMLSFITLNGNLTKDLPKVSYIKASEIWFFGGAAFIFLSLTEFAFVNVIWRRKKKVELAKHSTKYIIKCALSPRLARKDLRKSESFSSLESKHCVNNAYVHGSSNSLNVPTINTPINENHNGPDSGSPTPTPSQQAWQEMTPQEVAIWIDRKARIVFPVMFLLYNLLYWTFVYAL